MRSLRTWVLLVLAAVPALLFGSAGTAQAHPFGTPPVVKAEARGPAVEAAWSAQKDAAFGAGMALALTGVGMIVLRGRDVLLDRVSRPPALRTWTRRVPLFAASAVVASGAVASALAAGQLLAP
ncbi:hypothetical protein OG735_27475 [Streptomyces sp. NBC_01210]|uniref:hypothetical protein n=1 Tax=Streptomyces sp. NBC_01210 TaxID=2903774 RepID=UPI002E0FFA03|nr:hypothetical protein OG735_27475 [Streptomyces sp. NBC_01210]